jgi:hypothetical protein
MRLPRRSFPAPDSYTSDGFDGEGRATLDAAGRTADEPNTSTVTSHSHNHRRREPSASRAPLMRLPQFCAPPAEGACRLCELNIGAAQSLFTPSASLCSLKSISFISLQTIPRSLYFSSASPHERRPPPGRPQPPCDHRLYRRLAPTCRRSAATAAEASAAPPAPPPAPCVRGPAIRTGSADVPTRNRTSDTDPY